MNCLNLGAFGNMTDRLTVLGNRLIKKIDILLHGAFDLLYMDCYFLKGFRIRFGSTGNRRFKGIHVSPVKTHRFFKEGFKGLQCCGGSVGQKCGD